jgi:hypothetical protein
MNTKRHLNCSVWNGIRSRIPASLLATALALAGAISSAAWQVQSGAWVITDNLLPGSGVLLQGSGAAQTYSYAYLSEGGTDYTVEGQVKFPAGAYGGGLGGRLNPLTGAHYAAWIYPEGSPGGSNVLRLIKFQTWTNWGYNGVSYTPMQTVGLAGVGTGWHTLRLAFHGNQIAVYFDGNQMMSVADVEPEPYLSGGISADMWTDSAIYTMSLNDVLPHPLVLSDSYSVNANTTLTVAGSGLLGNDTGVYGTNLTAVLASGPTNGTLTLDSNGGFTYTPATNFTGRDSFVYQANDSQTSLGTAAVNITVNPAVITVVGVGASNKIYGGTTGATLSFNNAALVGVAGGDNVSLDTTSAAGAFADASVGTGKLVTVTGLALLGADDGKYTLTQPTTHADITPATLTPNVTVASKAYDATTAATITGRSLSGIVGSDDVSLGSSGVAAFADKNAGTSKSVSITLLTLSGSAATNYVLATTSATASAEITPLPITVTADPKTKIFGDPDPIFTYRVSNGSLVGGDSFLGYCSRVPGEDAGTYAVLRGSLTAGNNYDINFVSADLTIARGDSSLMVVSALNPAAPGAIVTITADLYPIAPNSLRPTGSVQFYLNDTPYGSPIPIIGGGASFSTAELPVGPNVVLAAYSGDSNCLGSTNILVQIIDPGAVAPAALGITVSKSGTVTVAFLGTPGSNYVVQACGGIAPPVWQNVSTNTADAQGRWTFSETPGSVQSRFYRATTP